MTATRIVSLALVPVLTLLGDLRAQERRPIVPGVTVRVSAPPVVEKHVVGFVVSLDRDTLVLNVEGRAAPLMIPLVSVGVLEVHRGRKSRIGRGALIGLGVGVAVGGVSGFGLCEMDETKSGCEFHEHIFGSLISGALFGLLGGGFGALIGVAVRTDRWEAVPLERIRVGLTRHGGRGLALTASVSF